MVYYSELLYYFPAVLTIPGKDVYDETNYSYIINKSKSPLKIPPNGQIYNKEILNQLQLVRKDLYKSESEDDLRIKLINLYEHWGPQGLNILNEETQKIIIQIVNKIHKKKIHMNELIKYAQDLHKYNNTDSLNLKKQIDELTNNMNNVLLNINSKNKEEINDKKIENLLNLLQL